MPRPSPAAKTPVLALSTTLRRAVAGLARRLRMERPEHDVSLAKLSVLGHLYRLGPRTGAQLAGLERIRPQSLTRLLADLEGRTLISKRADEQDGRRLLIEITTQGKEVLIRDMRQRDAWLALAISSELSSTEQDVLRQAAQLMERLAQAHA